MMTSKQPFERIVSAHGMTVLRVCRAVLGPHTDADDAWSETFLAAMRAYPQLPDDANVQAWLVTIAHRKALDVIRSRKRQHALVEAAGWQALTGGPEHTEQLDLWVLVNALPDRQRQVIAYRYLGGLPYKDIAGLLGGSPEAARRAAADGLKSLRALFAEAATAPAASYGAAISANREK